MKPIAVLIAEARATIAHMRQVQEECRGERARAAAARRRSAVNRAAAADQERRHREFLALINK